MRTASPQAALQAAAWPRLLASSWPWRSVGYLLTTMPVALAAFTGLAIVSLPWLELGARLAAGNYQAGAIAGLALLGAALAGLAGPAAAIPLAELERRRLRVVDARPAASGHRRPPATGARAWLATRYTEPATWRETGYACLLATVAPALSAAALSAVPLAAALIASPFLVLAQQPGSAPVALGFGTAATAGQAVPYAMAGVGLLLLAPTCWY